jgi:2-methylcitrate dehydratase PrpD
MTAQSEISPFMQELSGYAARAIRRPLPPEVTERARIHLVDSFGAIVSGSRLVPGVRTKGYVRALGGIPECTVIGTRMRTSAVNAAFANGMFAHADETDDTHPPSRTHPGASVVPAAFAIAERQQASGQALLRAMALGYDVCSRLLLAIDEQKFRYSGHHASSFGGIFGAAAAAAALLRLDERRARYAFSYAAQQAAGLYTMHRETEHIEKAFAMGGMTAHNGVAAALMVAHGFTGVDDVFSGDRDFFHTFAPNADRAQLARGLGRDYEILRGGIKRWTVGGPIQGPLDALSELIARHGIKAPDVRKLVARMPEKELETVNDRDMPNICVQHQLALMLVDGCITFKSAHDRARMKDPRVRAMRGRIVMQGDPALTDKLRRWRCIMTITLNDGRELHHETLSAKGGFDNPVSRQDEEAKAVDLMAPVLGQKRAAKLIAALWDIDRVKNVRRLRTLLTA